MKECYYFPHDYNARTDPKLQAVRMDMGMAGIGLYWCIVEQLYEQGGALPLASADCIAYDLHVEADMVLRLIKDYGLFENDESMFWSNSAARRIADREELSEKRKAASKKANFMRWHGNEIANASQTDCKRIPNGEQDYPIAMQGSSDCLPIKGNKIKGNKIKESDNPRTREEVLIRFFRDENKAMLEKLCMDNHTDMDNLQATAHQIVNEWCLTEQSHKDYNDAAQHLINLLRIKLHGQSNNDNKESDSRAERQAGAMRVIQRMQRDENATDPFGNA